MEDLTLLDKMIQDIAKKNYPHLSLTPLDKMLQEMIIKNYPQFIELMGRDGMTALKVRLLCVNGKTLRQIGYQLDVTKRHAQYHCDKCKPDKKSDV